MACLLKVSFPVLSFKSCSTSLRHTANMRPGIQTQMPFHGHCSLTGLLLDRNPPYRTWIFYSWARISRIASKTRYSELFITPGEFLTHLQTQPSQKCGWRRRCQRPLEDVHICLLTGVRSHAWLRDTLTGQWPAPWHTAQHIRSSRPGPVQLGHLGQLLALSLSLCPSTPPTVHKPWETRGLCLGPTLRRHQSPLPHPPRTQSHQQGPKQQVTVTTRHLAGSVHGSKRMAKRRLWALNTLPTTSPTEWQAGCDP